MHARSWESLDKRTRRAFRAHAIQRLAAGASRPEVAIEVAQRWHLRSTLSLRAEIRKLAIRLERALED